MKRKKKSIEGLIVDPVNGTVFPGKIWFTDRIHRIERVSSAEERYIVPGFIDAHIHIESSMLIPSRFAQIAVPHGTVAVVADPHEIANVMGVDGVEFMIRDAERVPMRFYFTAPSCVPATPFETTGAKIGIKEIRALLKKDTIVALAEVMNYPAVVHGVSDVMKKIEVAKRMGKPIDGHAPGLRGNDMKIYVDAGISTDHECLSLSEAIEKAEAGMTIMIRDGSSVKDLDKLFDITKKYEVFFVSDDLHPDDLLSGHLDGILRRSVAKGMDIFKALRAVSSNPSMHYQLPTGRIREGMYADFVIIDSIVNFKVKEVWINGEVVAKDGKPLFRVKAIKGINVFNVDYKKPEDFEVKTKGKEAKVRVIEVIDKSLMTREVIETLDVVNGVVYPDISRDILKITVVDRYRGKNVGVGFIKGFGIKDGAIAGSVAHDSHNVLAVGTSDELLTIAVNEVIKMKGGLVALSRRKKVKIPLPIAGLMSNESPRSVINKLSELSRFVKETLGSRLHNPFGTLSFMALTVIPELKLSDKGLFDSRKFEFVSVIL